MTRFTICTFCLCTAFFCSTALFAQGVNKPKITNIPGGFFAEWDSPVELAAVQLDKKLSGAFEVMFDVPSVSYIANEIDKKSATTSNPDMVTALSGYWMMRGKPERAIPLYETSLEHGNIDEGRSLIFQNNLAMLYSQALGEHEKALEIVKNALESKKDNVTLLDTKGLILLNSGNPAEAIEPLQRAVELSCQLSIYCMHLAYAFHQNGQPTPARRWFDQALDKLIPAAQNMGKENRKMFDDLQRAFPPASTQ